MGEKVGYKVKSKLHIKSKVYVDKKKAFLPLRKRSFKKLLKKTCHLWSRQCLSIPCVLSSVTFVSHTVLLACDVLLVCKRTRMNGKEQFDKQRLLHTFF